MHNIAVSFLEHFPNIQVVIPIVSTNIVLILSATVLIILITVCIYTVRKKASRVHIKGTSYIYVLVIKLFITHAAATEDTITNNPAYGKGMPVIWYTFTAILNCLLVEQFQSMKTKMNLAYETIYMHVQVN